MSAVICFPRNASSHCHLFRQFLTCFWKHRQKQLQAQKFILVMEDVWYYNIHHLILSCLFCLIVYNLKHHATKQNKTKQKLLSEEHFFWGKNGFKILIIYLVTISWYAATHYLQTANIHKLPCCNMARFLWCTGI